MVCPAGGRYVPLPQHPSGVYQSEVLPGLRLDPSALTRGDCAEFHRKVFVPNNTVVALVGDIDSTAIVDEVKKYAAAM